jgi:hypothetical protein
MPVYHETYAWLGIERKFGPWLNPEEMRMVKTVRDYMQQSVKPRVWELEAAFHGRGLDSAWDVLAELNVPLVRIGLQKAAIPETYGGLELSLPFRLAMAEEVCSDDFWVGAVCFTEPQRGVNFEDTTLRGRTGRVIAEMDGGEYVLKGEKIFPGPSGPPEFFSERPPKRSPWPFGGGQHGACCGGPKLGYHWPFLCAARCTRAQLFYPL